MVNLPKNHISFKCFACKKDRCYQCHGTPHFFRYKKCDAHDFGKCTHSISNVHFRIPTILPTCKNVKCESWVRNFIRKPNAYVEQNFLTQIERMTNTGLDFLHIRVDSKQAISPHEHAYGKHVKRLPTRVHIVI